MANMTNPEEEFRDLARFSSDIGIPKERLVDAFHIEREFHNRILKEPEPQKRATLYAEVYRRVHVLYRKSSFVSLAQNPKERVVRMFRRELRDKSILDVGCGDGAFLFCVHRLLRHRDLVGMDISTPVIPEETTGLRFREANIVNFSVDRTFDVVFSDNVMEHLAPSDLSSHLRSVRKAVRDDGLFILLTPNRLFGPSDVTRILDYSYSNRIPAQGTHLNESSYSELLPLLRRHGFRMFKTVCPLPRLKETLGLRISPSVLTFIETHRPLLSLLQMIKWRSRCVIRCDVILICQTA